MCKKINPMEKKSKVILFYIHAKKTPLGSKLMICSWNYVRSQSVQGYFFYKYVCAKIWYIIVYHYTVIGFEVLRKMADRFPCNKKKKQWQHGWRSIQYFNEMISSTYTNECKWSISFPTCTCMYGSIFSLYFWWPWV